MNDCFCYKNRKYIAIYCKILYYDVAEVVCMQIVTININKGGTGKSTFSYNFSKWLSSRKNKKVLLIDGDSSCNLTYSFKELGTSSIYDVFKGGGFEIYPVDKNMDFIKGSEFLTDEDLELRKKQNNCLILFMWFADNIEMLSKYDYVIIDTHNDASLVTSNFIAVADAVIGVSEPSRNGYRAWLELKETINRLKSEVVDIMTRKSYIQAVPYLIGNKIEHIGRSSREFLDIIANDPGLVGIIPKKELLAKSLLSDKSIFELQDEMSSAEKKRHRKFYEHIEEVFEKIINTI